MSDLGGGTGNHVLQMASHWDRERWHIELLSLAQLTSRIEPPLPVTYMAPSSRYCRYPVSQVRQFQQIKRFLQKTSFDIVHAYFYWPILYARLLKKWGIVRQVVENREDQGFSWRKRDYALLRLTCRQPDRVICVSNAVRKVVLQREKLDPARVEVVYNGVGPCDAPALDRVRIRLQFGLPKDALLVGMVANLNRPVKGGQYFIEAVPRIVRAEPRARFIVIGCQQDDQLQQLIADRGLAEYVVLAGYREDVDSIYRAMDVSVLTSLSEGLSITLLESMKAGLPVVATGVGGNPEVVDDGITGFVVPPRDPEAFAAKVALLLQDGSLRYRMGCAGRARAERHFRIERTAARYLQVYEEVLESSQGSGR
jgi:glycosyltransferase involved in cell wall biosynthesis